MAIILRPTISAGDMAGIPDGHKWTSLSESNNNHMFVLQLFRLVSDLIEHQVEHRRSLRNSKPDEAKTGEGKILQ